MHSRDPIYDSGFLAGKNGATKKDNPHEKIVQKGIYSLTNYDRWESGRQDGRRCCPCCNGTGKINTDDNLVAKLEEKISAMQKTIDGMYNGDISNMTKEELAEKLNGREYLKEITRIEASEAKKAGLIVFYGQSDDLVEIAGWISDEVDAYDGTVLSLLSNGAWAYEVQREDEEVLEKYGLLEEARRQAKEAHKISALWCAEPDGPSWTFETSLPHATFKIMEDGEIYCRGIVIDMRDLGGEK